MELRDYQEEALARVAEAEARGIRRQLGVAATGLGKTVMFVALARQRGGRTLILVHRDELVSQAVAKVRELWPEVGPVGIVKAEQDDTRAQVIVASVQTLSRPQRLSRLLSHATGEGSMLPPVGPFDLVIVDEAHHATADSYKLVLAGLRAGLPAELVCPACLNTGEVERLATPEEVDDGYELGVAFDACPNESWHMEFPAPQGPLLLGVTATPDRGDGQALEGTFDEIVWTYDMLWGIRAGHLSDLRGIQVKIDTLNLSNVKVTAGDFNAGQAGAAMEASNAHRYIVEAWRRHAADRRTLVFTPTVETARLTAEEFAHHGVAAAYVHGGTPLEERRQLLADYQAGKVQVLANCAVLTEGFDAPRTDCVVMARPTKSRALYTQCVGRGTRMHPDKADCLVLDIVGASARHSLVTVPTLAGLTGKDATRMRDGKGTLADVALQRDERLVAAGRMRATEVDLFRRARAIGRLAWVPSAMANEHLQRYTLSLGIGRPTVVLAERREGLWTSGLLHVDGGKEVLIARVDMETAMGVAEAWVRHHQPGGMALMDKSASWRAKPPSDKMRVAAFKWHIEVKPDMTAGEVSDLINRRAAIVQRAKERKARKVAR